MAAIDNRGLLLFNKMTANYSGSEESFVEAKCGR